MTRTMANSGGSPGASSQVGSGAVASTAGGSGIPANFRDTVMNIKEIVAQSSETEIYLMLQQCGMDVDETVQRLVSQDDFQEVKRKRDRKREIKNGSDAKPAGRGSGGRSGRWHGAPRSYNSNNGFGRGRARYNGNDTKSSEAPAPAAPTVPTTQSSVPVENGPAHPHSAATPFAEVVKVNGPAQQPARPTVLNGPVAGKTGNHNGKERRNGPERPASRGGAQPSESQTVRTGASAARANKPQHPPVGAHRVAGPAQEWKAKVKPTAAVPPVVNVEVSIQGEEPKSPKSPPKVEVQEQPAEREERPVIIHNQFLVSADLGLSFGSINFNSEGELQAEPKPSTSEDVQPAEEADNRPSSSPGSGSLDQNYSLQQTSDSLPSNSEVTSVSIPVASQPEASRPESVQTSQYPYLPAYSSFGLVAQPGAQYAYESPDSQLSDGTRFSTPQQYSDPAPSYYTPTPTTLTYRPNGEGDIRYPSSGTKSRYNSGNMSTVAAQTLAATESGNSSSSLTQTSQPASGQSLPSVPHQHLPLHAAYSAQPGLHLGFNMFNYPYLPQSVPYMHPYQHSFAGSNAYPQPPTGSSYPSTNNYPAGGGKYPVAQFKPATATVSTTTAAGYGGYTSTPTGYATNPTVTIGTASVYDDVSASQFKDNNMYQQAEGSQMWLRDSYYNIPGQSHTAYAHAYGSLYHPTQSVPAPNSHQILQQPQGIAAAGGGQGTAYAQQPQRAQQTWTHTY